MTSSEVETLHSILPYIRFVGSGVGGKPTIQFGAVNVQVVNGDGRTESVNGEGNLVIGYDENPENKFHERRAQTGSHNLILGEVQTFTSYGGILAGAGNTISAPFASVTAGDQNTASGEDASVSGGNKNTASALWASVTGGTENAASNELASVSGGVQNHASGEFTSITGGGSNTASGNTAAIQGGFKNVAEGNFSSIFGGKEVTVKGTYEYMP